MASVIQYRIHHCPACGISLDGGMIPVERRRLFDGAERYSKAIYLNTYLACPSCYEDLGPRSSTGNSNKEST